MSNNNNPPHKADFLKDPALTYLTTRQVAQLLGVGINIVSRYVREGRLEGRKVDGRWFIKRDSALAFATRDRKVGRPKKLAPA